MSSNLTQTQNHHVELEDGLDHPVGAVVSEETTTSTKKAVSLSSAEEVDERCRFTNEFSDEFHNDDGMILASEDREILLEEEEMIIDEMNSIENGNRKTNEKNGLADEENNESIILNAAEEDEGSSRVIDDVYEQDEHNLSGGRRRIWSIDLGRFMSLDDTNLGDLTSHHEAAVHDETAHLPPLALEEKDATVSTLPPSAIEDNKEQPKAIESSDSVHLQINRDDEIIEGRDRGLSFEIFASFHDVSSIMDGTSSDLPITTRPRGDSIIFDQCNFNDDPEKPEDNILSNELLSKRRGYSVSSFTDTHDIERQQPEFVSSNAAIPIETQSSEQPYAIAETINENDQHANFIEHNPTIFEQPHYNNINQPLPTTTTNGNLDSNGVLAPSQDSILPSVACCQMELLNKGGRIGIYLPEARKARIAKFHSKRKLRIWRKRIKYDCRKKLADSRPRIKGRFVKRIDVEPPQQQPTSNCDAGKH